MRKYYKFIGVSLFFMGSVSLHAQNSALDFDGVNDYIDCGNDTSVQLGGQFITLEAWINASSWKRNTYEGNIINKEAGSPSGYQLRAGNGGVLEMVLGDGSWKVLTSSAPVLTLNTWHHIAGVFDGNYMRLFVDGVATDSISSSFNFVDAAGKKLMIGSWSNVGRHFAGKMDEVRIWNVARSKAEINASMNTEICNNDSGLVAYYRFNEGVSGGTNLGATTAFDATNNNNDASLNNFTLNGSTSNYVTSVSSLASFPYTSADQPKFESSLICISPSDTAEIVISDGNLNDAEQWSAHLSGCDSQQVAVTIGNTLKVSPASLGVYTYFIRGEGACVSPGLCDSVVVKVTDVPELAVKVTDESQGNDGAVDLSVLSGTPPFKFDWDNDGIGDWDDTEDLTGLAGGTYHVTVEDSNQCIVETSAHVDSITTVGIVENDTKFTPFNLYPNPASKLIFANFNQAVNSKDQLQLINTVGKVVQQIKLVANQQRYSIELEALVPGVYFLQFQSLGKVSVKKMVVQ